MKRMIFMGVICLLFICSGAAFGQDRFLYVDGFSDILGDEVLEDALLEYARARNIRCLLLYDLHLILGSRRDDPRYAVNSPVLAAFFDKARAFGIEQIAATGEQAQFFEEVIERYNTDQSEAANKFDVYNLEFEYWNPIQVNNPDAEEDYCRNYLLPQGFSCDRDGAFAFYLEQLEKMRALADASSHPLLVETYLGWPDQGEAVQIDALVDRVLLHAYTPAPASTFGNTEERLQFFAFNSRVTDIAIIFSSEPDFMQAWLEANCMLLAEQIYREDYDKAGKTHEALKQFIHLLGFTYFTYSVAGNVPRYCPCGSADVVLDYTIQADEIVNCQAVNSIRLVPGFHAEEGSTFWGDIGE